MNPNSDLDRADRRDKWRMATTLLGLALVVVVAWLLVTATSASQDRAVSEASQKFTLAQQVAAACAVKEQADDLGGLCASATQIIKEGPAGSPGLAGPPGDTGPQGPLGPKGEQGDRGFAGVVGATGPQGIFGKAGDQGVAGPSGGRGVAGADGAVGATGAVGPTGPAGVDGQPGAIGATGPTGPAGKTPTAMTCVRDPGDTWACTVTATTP